MRASVPGGGSGFRGQVSGGNTRSLRDLRSRLGSLSDVWNQILEREFAAAWADSMTGTLRLGKSLAKTDTGGVGWTDRVKEQPVAFELHMGETVEAGGGRTAHWRVGGGAERASGADGREARAP